MIVPYKLRYSLPKRAPWTLLILLICCVCLSSCTGACIAPQEIVPQVLKLRSSNSKNIQLNIQSKKDFNPVGHQYLFFVIPFGRISLADTVTSIHNEVYTRLAVLGINVSNAANSRLEISIENVQLSAYDLFVIRNIYCEIELKLSVYDSNGALKRTWNQKTGKSAYKALAFHAELEHIFRQCLSETINQALVSL